MLVDCELASLRALSGRLRPGVVPGECVLASVGYLWQQLELPQVPSLRFSQPHRLTVPALLEEQRVGGVLRRPCAVPTLQTPPCKPGCVQSPRCPSRGQGFCQVLPFAEGGTFQLLGLSFWVLTKVPTL